MTVKVSTEQKKLGDLMRALGGNRLPSATHVWRAHLWQRKVPLPFIISHLLPIVFQNDML